MRDVEMRWLYIKELDKKDAEIERLREQVPEWVSCGDRVPEEKSLVLTLDKHGAIKMLFYVPDAVCQWTDYSSNYLTPAYWRPLPKPPTEVE